MERDFSGMISIIVPVYNAELFLDKCVCSILDQSYSNFELILIDDGSTDNSLIILKKYKELDDRITLIDKANSGVSDTRNIGIERAKGQHICFIDADDWVEEDYLLTFIESYKNEGTLLIQDIKRGEHLKSNYVSEVFHLEADIDKVLLQNKILNYGGPFAKFFEVSLIKGKNIRFFPKITFGEDLIFYMEYLKEVENLKFIDEASYNYNYNSNSATTKKHSFYSLFNLHLKTKSFIEEMISSKKMKDESINYMFQINWDFIERVINEGILGCNNKTEQKEGFLKLQNSVNNEYYRYAITINRKIIYILIKLGSFRLLKLYEKNIKGFYMKSRK